MKDPISILKKARIANIINFILVVIGVVWVLSGFIIGKPHSMFGGVRLYSLIYFTTQSNILAGTASLIAAIMQKKVIDGKIHELPGWVYVFKLVGVVSIALTMFVMVFYFFPIQGFRACYTNSNFFMHLLNPLVSIITFLGYENTDKIRFRHTFTGITFMLVYAVVYLIQAIIFSDGNVVALGHDWYGFLSFGLKSVFIVGPVIVLSAYLLSLLLWYFNRKLIPGSKQD